MNSKSMSFDLPQYILEHLDKLAKSESFINYSISNSPNASHGKGFTSYIVRVLLEGSKEVNGSVKNEKLHLICKYAPEGEKRRKINNIIPQFERESYMYNKVLPALVQFQKEKNISLENGFYNFPKCYVTISDKESNQFLMILEDLSIQGYTLSDKFLSFDIDHTKLFLQELAKFHALSFALRDQKPHILEEFKLVLTDIFILNHKENAFMKKLLQYNLRRTLNSLECKETVGIAKMENIINEFFNILSECIQPGVSEPFSVIAHSDCWSNNFMYQYDQIGIPKQIQFLDWQLSQIGTPALDITFFMFTSTNSKFRQDHYDDLLKFYYSNLENMLTDLGSDATKLFTYENLKQQLKKFGKYGFILSPMYVSALSIDSKTHPDMDILVDTFNSNADVGNLFNFFENEKSNKSFNDHMSNVLRDCVKHGYL